MANAQSFSIKRKRDWRLGRKAPSESVAKSSEASDTWRLTNGTLVTIRVSRPNDGLLMQTLVRGLSLASRYHRFFYATHELEPALLDRFTHANPLQTMSLLAVIREHHQEIAVGMAQYITISDFQRCEFAVVVSDAWQRKGIARRLIRDLICIARKVGLQRMEGEILTENEAMQQLLTNMDFALLPHPDGPYLMKAWKSLHPPEWPCSPLITLASSASREAISHALQAR